MKKIQLDIISCADCPYCQYNGDYGRSYDSGYDCSQTNRRIADDYDIKKHDEEVKKWSESMKTLFPQEYPFDTTLFDIPDWCPLQDGKENENG